MKEEGCPCDRLTCLCALFYTGSSRFDRVCDLISQMSVNVLGIEF